MQLQLVNYNIMEQVLNYIALILIVAFIFGLPSKLTGDKRK